MDTEKTEQQEREKQLMRYIDSEMNQDFETMDQFVEALMSLKNIAENNPGYLKYLYRFIEELPNKELDLIDPDEWKSLDEYLDDGVEWIQDVLTQTHLADKMDDVSGFFDYEDDAENMEVYSLYIGSVMSIFPSSKFYMQWTSNQTNLDVQRDEAFRRGYESVLEDEKENPDGWELRNGDGDPTDLFLIRFVEVEENEGDGEGEDE